jgi:protein tyrosine/serine phosphatase
LKIVRHFARALLCLALSSPLLAGDAAPVTAATAARPAQWAERVVLDGVPNLYRLTPEVYRSEQPTALGMKNLEKLGIRTVIDLRAFSDDEARAKGTSLRLERVKIVTWHIGDEHVIDVMRKLRETANGPFLIHCQHGADRTGLMSAMYRVLEQGWTADEALKELVEGGYGYHSIWKNIIRYVRSADVSRLRSAIDSTRTVTDNL